MRKANRHQLSAISFLLLASVCLAGPPRPPGYYAPGSELVKGSQLLISGAAVAKSSLTATSGSPKAAAPDALTVEVLTNTVIRLMIPPGAAIQCSTNGINGDWFDVETTNAGPDLDCIVGYDFRPEAGVFFRLKP